MRNVNHSNNMHSSQAGPNIFYTFQRVDKDNQTPSLILFSNTYICIDTYCCLRVCFDQSTWIEITDFTHTETHKDASLALCYLRLLLAICEVRAWLCVCTFWNSDECNHCQLLEAVDFNGNAISACVCGDESRSGFERGFRLTR